MRIPLTTLLFFLCGLTASAQLQLMPLSDVRPGMKGTGRTVFSGGAVEEFQAEILGILENAGPKQSIILARLSGGPLEKTGVLQGMSGSPVYIDGKLIGAVALVYRAWELWSVGYLPLPQQSPGLALAAAGVALVLYGAGSGFGVARRY
jgi:hypothetical protein